MDFGLGLVLSFTDNATAGINNAVHSLNQLTSIAEKAGSSLDKMASLSALSVVADKVGSAFLNAGKGIISMLGQVASGVINTGRTLRYAENQLNALYASSNKSGKDVLNQIQEYAETSMFAFEDLIPAVTSLKSVGIEAFDAITSSMGTSKYSLLDYASALASFAPQMKNAYGTGINAAIGAMREYIAEGNAMSLKRGAGLDITGILGEDKGKTIEERERQIADLVEKLGMLGMVDLMKSSPEVMLSNIGDVLFKLKGLISESGVYAKYTELIKTLSDYVMAIPDEELASIANTIGSALTTIMTPLEWVIKKLISLVDVIRNLVANHPQLVKIATVGVTIAGVLLILAGVALKATSAMSGLSLMLLTSGKSFKNMGTMFKTGIAKILGTLLPLIAIASVLHFAWKNDLGGLRTEVTKFVKNVSNSFSTARKLVGGSVEDLVSSIDDLRNKGDFFSNFTIGLTKVMMVFKALSDAWGDNTLSEDNFLKAKELGILPLIEAVLDLKYRFGLFKDGFIAGWKKIGEGIKNAISGFTENIEGTALESLLDNLTIFLEKLASGDAQAWYEFGESFATFTAYALALWGAVKLIGGTIGTIVKVITAVKGLFSILGTISNVLFKVFSVVWDIGVKVVGIISKVFGVLKTVVSAIGNFLTTTFGGIVLVVAGIITAVVNFFDMLKNGFSWVKEILMIVGIAIAAIGAIILGAPALVAGVIAAIVAAVATAVVLIKEHWQSILDAFSNLGTWLYDHVIMPVGNFLGNFFKGLINMLLEGIVGKINNFIKAINFAIGIINAIPGVNIKKITELQVPQLAQGGVVSKPTLSVIGEAGTEAVMPLENNTGWIGVLSKMIATEMGNIVPTNRSQYSPVNHGSTTQRYLTTNNNSTHTVQGNTDNSVIFNAGAIQVTVQNATEAEAIRLAKMVMEYIKRQKELDRMMRYA